MPNLAMAREGTQYSDPDGRFSLSWPWGGLREVLAIEKKDYGRPLKQRIDADPPAIVEVDDEANVEAIPLMSGVEGRISSGAEGKAIMDQPPPETITVGQTEIPTNLGGLAQPEAAEATEEASADEAAEDLSKLSREELNAKATELGVEGAEDMANKAEVIEAIEGAQDEE